MGRHSNLTEKQWAEIEQRLAKGEKGSSLAREFKTSPAAISRRFSKSNATVKSVANQVVAAEAALNALPIAQKVAALSLIDELKAISLHMAGAAKFGAATAHRLSGIAHAKVQEIDDAAPLDDDSFKALKGVAVLTKMANEAAVIPTALLSANKDMIREANAGEGADPADTLRELAELLPD